MKLKKKFISITRYNYGKPVTAPERTLKKKAALPWTFFADFAYVRNMTEQGLQHENEILHYFQG